MKSGLLILTALLMPMTLLAHDAALAAARDDCVSETAYWVSGRLNKAFDDVNAVAAVTACKIAITRQPDDAYLQALYCRALYKKELVLLAMEYCSCSASTGDPFGMTLLGNLYEFEVRQPGFKEKSFAWYLQAAKAGDSDGQFRLGRAYLYGIGTEKNSELAAQWLTASAQQGHPSGAMGLAMQEADPKQPDASRQRFRRALQLSAATFGAEHPYHSGSVKIYIDWMSDAGLIDEAQAEVDFWLGRLNGDSLHRTHATVKLLALEAGLLEKKKKPKQAIDVYRDALELIGDDFARGHTDEWFKLVVRKSMLEQHLKLNEDAFATSRLAWDTLGRLKLHDYQMDLVLCETMNKTKGDSSKKDEGLCMLY